MYQIVVYIFCVWCDFFSPMFQFSLLLLVECCCVDAAAPSDWFVSFMFFLIFIWISFWYILAREVLINVCVFACVYVCINVVVRTHIQDDYQYPNATILIERLRWKLVVEEPYKTTPEESFEIEEVHSHNFLMACIGY